MNPIAALAGWLLLTFLAPAAGAWATSPQWYQQLVRPSWSPPPWIFAPVWTFLYATMALAAWIVWQRGGWETQRAALTIYCVQLALNASWTPIFFGLRRPGLALAEIILLWLAIIVTICFFATARPLAAWLLGPYALWVTFAMVLNGAIWRLNA